MWGHAILLDQASTGGLRYGWCSLWLRKFRTRTSSGVDSGCRGPARGNITDRAGTALHTVASWSPRHLGPRAGPRHVRDCTLGRTVRRRATVPFHGVARQIERPQDKHVRLLCAQKSTNPYFLLKKVRQRRAFPHLTRPRGLGLSRLGRKAFRPHTVRASTRALVHRREVGSRSIVGSDDRSG